MLSELRKRSTADSAELTATLNDIAQMIELGRYYAAKIRGATSLALYRATKERTHQQQALEQLRVAADRAAAYASRATRSYGPRVWTNRVGHVDFAEFAAGARADIEIARAAPK